MSNKFGKFLLAGAAIGSAIGTTFYLMKKKKNVPETPEEYEEITGFVYPNTKK